MRSRKLLLLSSVSSWHGMRIVLAFIAATSSLLAETEIRRAFPESVIPRALAFQEAPLRTESASNGKPKSDSAVVIAAQAQLESAHSLYAKKMYDLAISQYEKFLTSSGAKAGAEGRDAALFRLGESHRILGHRNMACNAYSRLIQEFPSGEFTASAAYRLGEMFYSTQNYFEACPQFQLAATHAKEEGIRLSALFYQARCLELIRYKSKALAIYKQLLATEKDNPFYYYALMVLAQDDVDTGSPQAGLDKFDQVAKSAPHLVTRIEANVRAANVAIALNQTESALRKFHDAIATPIVAPEWKSAAWVGLFQLYYQKGDYDRIIAEQEKAAFSSDVRAEGLFLLANAYRQLQKFTEASQIYSQIVQEFPQSQEAKEAQFQKLIALYSLENVNLLEEIAIYEKQDLAPLRRAQVSLLKAETLFRKKQFLEAALLFQDLQKSELPDHLKVDALYKLGWCYTSSQRSKEAILVYSQFIEKYPHSPLIPNALLQRGLAHQQNNEPAEALNDYDALIAQFPEVREREIALLRRALLLGARDDKEEMVETFQRLLSEYPHTPATAQANFWLGWAAYENKDYKNAISYLEKARTLDKTHYHDSASLRILLASYYLKDLEAASREAACIKPENIPVEILRWLGEEFIQLSRFVEAEHYLCLYLNSHPDPTTSAEVTLSLAEIQLKLKNYSTALSTIESYLTTARDPASRAQGLFLKVQMLEGEGRIDEALQLAYEIQLLQPEGISNARARLMEADLQMQKQDYLKAARHYMTVALLYDDSRLTLQALKSAIQAYRQAHLPLDEQKAIAQLKKRFPNEALP